jgi:enoyl-CoA hydratase
MEEGADSTANPPDAPISLGINGFVATLGIRRPRVRNALDVAAVVAMDAALDRALELGARLLVVEGSEGTFCAGADLKALTVGDQKYRQMLAERGQEMLLRLESCPLLTVALIEGYCLGGGLELALACDLRIAVKGSVFGFPEVTIGGIPSWGGTQRLASFIGMGRAKQLLLTGERLGPEPLLAWGLLNELAETREAGWSSVKELAGRLESSSAESFPAIKQLLLMSRDQPLRMGLAAEAAADDELGEAIVRGAAARGFGEPPRPTPTDLGH